MRSTEPRQRPIYKFSRRRRICGHSEPFSRKALWRFFTNHPAGTGVTCPRHVLEVILPLTLGFGMEKTFSARILVCVVFFGLALCAQTPSGETIYVGVLDDAREEMVNWKPRRCSGTHCPTSLREDRHGMESGGRLFLACSHELDGCI
jgi:hypothetical protein